MKRALITDWSGEQEIVLFEVLGEGKSEYIRMYYIYDGEVTAHDVSVHYFWESLKPVTLENGEKMSSLHRAEINTAYRQIVEKQSKSVTRDVAKALRIQAGLFEIYGVATWMGETKLKSHWFEVYESPLN